MTDYIRILLDNDLYRSQMFMGMGGMLIYRRIFEKEGVYWHIKKFNKKLADALDKKLNETCRSFFIEGEFEAKDRERLRILLEDYLVYKDGGVRWLDEQKIEAAKKELSGHIYDISSMFKKMDDNSFNKIRDKIRELSDLLATSVG